MMGEWKLISTAPQDMQHILVFVPAQMFGSVEELPAMIHVAFLKRGDYHLQDDDHTIVDPTHWQPLPADPES